MSLKTTICKLEFKSMWNLKEDNHILVEALKNAETLRCWKISFNKWILMSLIRLNRHFKLVPRQISKLGFILNYAHYLKEPKSIATCFWIRNPNFSIMTNTIQLRNKWECPQENKESRQSKNARNQQRLNFFWVTKSTVVHHQIDSTLQEEEWALTTKY